MYDKPMDMMDEAELDALVARAEEQRQKLAELRTKEAIEKINAIAKEAGLKVKITKPAASRPKKSKPKTATKAHAAAPGDHAQSTQLHEAQNEDNRETDHPHRGPFDMGNTY